jgi:hypothetical protein
MDVWMTAAMNMLYGRFQDEQQRQQVINGFVRNVPVEILKCIAADREKAAAPQKPGLSVVEGDGK